MPIVPVNAVPVSPLTPTDVGNGTRQLGVDTNSETSFGQLIEGLIDRANEPHLAADQAVQKLMTGETDNVHDVVMSVVKADMSFRLVLELRNRLTDAYQEIMRMQV